MTEPQLDPDPEVNESLHRLVDEIVRRLAPSELPAYMGDFLRECGRGGGHESHNMTYPGIDPIFLDSTIRPDGSIRLALFNGAGQVFWRATLRLEGTSS